MLVSGLVAVVAAVPVGLLAVRYVRIFFGILTLAFGMLFHSFLFKFYDLTGGDTGIRVLRPTILGMDWKELDKTAFLIGPFYYACLLLLVLLGWLMWRIVHSPLGLHLVAIRENPVKAEYLGVRVRQLRLIAFLISAFLWPATRALPTCAIWWPPPKPSPASSRWAPLPWAAPSSWRRSCSRASPASMW